MFVNSDLTDLLSLFNARGVRYLVVGGYAVVQHAEPRFTNDLDLCIGADKRNAVAVFDALGEFGAPLAGLAASASHGIGARVSVASGGGCSVRGRCGWAGGGVGAQRSRSADPAMGRFEEEGYFYRMGTPPSRVDVLMGIPGVAFEPAWRRRMEVDFDGLVVPFISREDLIEAKRASGRPQDLLDVESLLRGR